MFGEAPNDIIVVLGTDKRRLLGEVRWNDNIFKVMRMDGKIERKSLSRCCGVPSYAMRVVGGSPGGSR